MSWPANAEIVPSPRKPLAALRRAVGLLPLLLLLAFLALSARFYGQRAYIEPLWKEWGDAFSDNNALVAGQHFVERGFIALKGLPTDLPLVNGPYTGWPPLADLLNGFLRELGVESLFGFRCFTLITYVLFGIYLYAACALILGSRWAAAAATTLMCMTPYVYLFSDSLHEHMYIEFFRAALLYHFVKYLRSATRLHLWAGMAFAFLDTYTTWEHVPFMLALFVLYPVVLRSEVHPAIKWRNVLPFEVAVGAALSLYFLQVTFALGGVREAVVSFKERVAVRTLDVVTGEYFKGYGSKHFLKSITLAGYVTANLNRLTDTFMIPRPLLTVGVILLASLTYASKREFRSFLVIAIFLVSSVFWLAIFIQHTVIHGFTIRHLGPWVALLFTFSFSYVVNAFKVRLAGWRAIGESAPQLLVAAAVVAVLCAPVQRIVENYVGYYQKSTLDLAYRVQGKRMSDLGLENVAYRLGTVSTFGAGIGTPAALIDNSYITARPSNLASFWGTGSNAPGGVAMIVTLANSCDLHEIDLYAFGSKSPWGRMPEVASLQVQDTTSDGWREVASPLLKRPIRSSGVAPGVIKISYDIGSFTTRQVRVILAGDTGMPASDIGLCEVELWGAVDMKALNEDILSNGGFEKVNGNLPDEWDYFSYSPAKNQTQVVESDGPPTSKSFLIWNTDLNDSYLRRVVKLAPNAVYELSGRIKTEEVTSEKESGASLDIEGDVTKKWLTGRCVRGTQDWQPFRVEVSTPLLIKPDTRLVLECRLGYYGDGARGRAWFDDVELKRVR